MKSSSLSRRDLLKGFKKEPDPVEGTDWETSPSSFKAVIEQSCLALKDIHCQSCRDVCEPGAIGFAYGGNAIPIPAIDGALCTACGDCQSVCPSGSIHMNIREERRDV